MFTAVITFNQQSPHCLPRILSKKSWLTRSQCAFRKPWLLTRVPVVTSWIYTVFKMDKLHIFTSSIQSHGNLRWIICNDWKNDVKSHLHMADCLKKDQNHTEISNDQSLHRSTRPALLIFKEFGITAQPPGYQQRKFPSYPRMIGFPASEQIDSVGNNQLSTSKYTIHSRNAKRLLLMFLGQQKKRTRKALASTTMFQYISVQHHVARVTFTYVSCQMPEFDQKRV